MHVPASRPAKQNSLNRLVNSIRFGARGRTTRILHPPAATNAPTAASTCSFLAAVSLIRCKRAPDDAEKIGNFFAFRMRRGASGFGLRFQSWKTASDLNSAHLMPEASRLEACLPSAHRQGGELARTGLDDGGGDASIGLDQQKAFKVADIQSRCLEEFVQECRQLTVRHQRRRDRP